MPLAVLNVRQRMAEKILSVSIYPSVRLPVGLPNCISNSFSVRLSTLLLGIDIACADYHGFAPFYANDCDPGAPLFDMRKACF